MRVICEKNAAEFLARVEPYLDASPIENNVLRGIISGMSGNEGNEPILACVEDGGSIVLVAVQTPPRGLLVGRGGEAAVRTLVEHLAIARVDLPGTIGPKETAAAFAATWAARTGCAASVRQVETIYQLRTLIAPRAAPGRMREAEEADDELLAAWALAFQDEVGVFVGVDRDARPFVRGKRMGRQLFVWDDGQAVSMAAWAARTPAVVRVNFVYTPPEHRKKGYAGACVGELSRRLLEGSERCVLFADTANATSNGVYRRLGYERVSDFAHYDFSRG